MSDNYFSKQHITKTGSNDIVLKSTISSHQQPAIKKGIVNPSLNSHIKTQQQQCTDTLCTEVSKIS
jgi:hypothetical protein